MKTEWVKSPFYCTKYALTQGIKYCPNGEIRNDGYAKVGGFIWCSPGQWAVTWDGAVHQAENKRLKKIKSLEKQIKKLEVLTFDKKEVE